MPIPVSTAHTPEAVHAVIEDTFNRGDIDAFVAAHDADATVAVPPDGRRAHGLSAIRAATAPIFALRPHVTITVYRKLQTDDLALTRARWELVGTANDGSPVHLTGNGTIVSRRRPDGTWGIVLDDPLGASPEPANATAAGPTGSGMG
jgi:ketosteroid isomerase-like protein